MQLRGGSRATATSNIECFVTIVNDFQPLTIVTKGSILNDAAALDPSLQLVELWKNFENPSYSFPAGIYMLKVNNINTGARCEICSVNNK